MSQKTDLDKELDQEVEKDTWERQFYSEDEEEIDGLTRAQHRARNRRISPIAIVFIVFAILLIATPFIMRAYVNSKPSEVPKNNNTQVTINKNSSSSSKEESSSKAESSEAVSSSEEAIPPATESEEPEVQPAVEETPEEQQPVQPVTPPVTQTPEATEQYATVQQGQGPYRVAVNNGISLEELKRLNPGLTDDTVLTPGQQLRVK